MSSPAYVDDRAAMLKKVFRLNLTFGYGIAKKEERREAARSQPDDYISIIGLEIEFQVLITGKSSRFINILLAALKNLAFRGKVSSNCIPPNRPTPMHFPDQMWVEAICIIESIKTKQRLWVCRSAIASPDCGVDNDPWSWKLSRSDGDHHKDTKCK